MILEFLALVIGSTIIRGFGSSNTGKKIFGDIAKGIDGFFGNTNYNGQYISDYAQRQLLPSDGDFNNGIREVIEIESANIPINDSIQKTDYYENGNKYSLNGEYEKAIKEFQMQLHIDPKHIGAYIQLAMCYRNIGELNNAIESIEKALFFRPNIPNGYSMLGKLYCENGVPIKAIEYLELGIQQKPTATAYYELAKAYYLKGNCNEITLKYCDLSLEVNSMYYEALILKSTVYIEEGKLDNATELLKESIKNSNFDKGIQYSFVLSLCSVYCLQGEYELAINECEKALYMDKKSQMPYLYRVICHIAKGEFAIAENIVNTIQIEHELIYICKGYINIGTGKLQDAINVLNQAVKINDKNGESYNALYIAYSLLGSFGKAQLYLEKALCYKVKGQNFLPVKGVELKEVPKTYADNYEIVQYRYTGGKKFILHTAENKDGIKVVIKELNDYFASQQLYVNLFKKEIELIKSIKHKNVIEIIEYGINRYNDRYYIVMPLMKNNLADYVKRNSINEQEVINISLQILEGLKCLHRSELSDGKGYIIHRELKPTEVLFDFEGTVKISDFVNAKISSTFTSMGGASISNVFNDAEYFIAPERIQGKKVDLRADIYSLGALMYYMITGTPPFYTDEKEDSIQRKMRIMKGKLAPPFQLNQYIGKDLNGIILKSLESDREKRYQTDDDLISDLKKIKL